MQFENIKEKQRKKKTINLFNLFIEFTNAAFIISGNMETKTSKYNLLRKEFLITEKYVYLQHYEYFTLNVYNVYYIMK